MGIARKKAGEVFGLDRVGTAIVYGGLDRDYRRDVSSPEFMSAAQRIVDTWMRTSAPENVDSEEAVEVIADRLIDFDLMSIARLEAKRRQLECKVEEVMNPAATSKLPAMNRSAFSLVPDSFQQFVEQEVAKLAS